MTKLPDGKYNLSLKLIYYFLLKQILFHFPKKNKKIKTKSHEVQNFKLEEEEGSTLQTKKKQQKLLVK